jgi:uncharacterized protein
MFDTPISPRLDSRKLCDAEQLVQGFIEVAELPGLLSYLQSEKGKVEVTLQFQRDDHRRPTVTGTVEVKGVEIICQRCLQVAEQDLSSNLNVAVVLDESQAEKLPAELDAWIVEDGQLNLRELLDQELILSLPIVPYHADCEVETQYGDADGEQQEKENPFGVLAQLLQKD